ncbi:MAG: anthranilate synthase component I [Alphaproteobacteria bacterium]|nr:anthranilate synthase component I [Alphaproteobacteria bacterium]USO07756.1 MAG: anthranilate synthase component I [Rhodospirillales bacterium]
MSADTHTLGTIWPDRAGFAAHAAAGRAQLVCLSLIADTTTPVAAYLRLTAHKPDHALLLESVTGGEVLGRYSAIGLDPDLIWRTDGTSATLCDTHGTVLEQSADPITHLKAQVAAAKIDVLPADAPPMLASGWFGYLGYGMIHLVEPTVPDTRPDPIAIPDSVMIRPTLMVVFDNIRQIAHLAVPLRAGADQAAYDDAVRRLHAARDTLLRGEMPLPEKGSNVPMPLPVRAHTDEPAYRAMVETAKEDIAAGEIFQVVLSQRFSAPFDLPASELYRSLRRLNPSPFLVLMTLDGFSLIASSPEIMVRVRKGDVTIRPIAGTRRRGADPDEDTALAAELLADPKERAEHLMLLDLGRNDVGRVAAIGSVRVTERFLVEKYSHVQHIVSNVEGRLRDGVHPLDALFAGFPAGTVSGAPKIRAMQIIDALEAERRGFYAGCIGYLDGNGDVDTCIALRTALLKDGTLYVQSGAGIVADSVPQSEHLECVNKARALLRAAEDALALSRGQSS